ncbi:MAG: AI-2E family transporter, partial [Methanosarcinaceae archaeon]|nr:AI-2E family transporter [Methanosarcinaceae archaeon]
MERPVKMMLALLLIIILAAVLSFSLLPYINAFFGAFILFVIFRPAYKFLKGGKKKRLGKRLAAFVVILLSIVIVLIPLYFLLSTVFGEAQELLKNRESLTWLMSGFDQLSTRFFARIGGEQMALETRLEEKLFELVSDIVNFISKFVLGSIQGLGRQFVNLTIMYFLLYYLFTGEDSDFMQKISAAIPFNDENTGVLLTEFKKVVRTTLIASGAIALVQGSILTFTFLLFGIDGAFLWGFIAAILSFLPVVGATF